jgi:hypothetical protein
MQGDISVMGLFEEFVFGCLEDHVAELNKPCRSPFLYNLPFMRT